MSQQPQPIDAHAIAAILWKRSFHWMAPAILLTILAALYAVFLYRPAWEARLSLMIREEAASGVSRDGRPGRFDGLEAMKTAQETVHELAGSRAVVAAALTKIGPPRDAAKSRAWPTPRDIEKTQDAIRVKPPKGAEFGKTEVFYLMARDVERQRALALTQAIVEELEARLKLVRDQRAQSLVEELSQAVELVRADRERTTLQLTALEQSVGGDLAELRMLTETTGGESNLRSSMTAAKNDLRAAQVAQQNREQLLEMLQAAQRDPAQLLATPNELLTLQPALQQLKNGLITAQLATAQLQGTMTDQHPLARAAVLGEAEIRSRIHHEIASVIRSLEAERSLGEGRIATLESQLNEAAQRMDHLASIRARYANMVSEVRHYDEMLQRAEQDLAAARASVAASHTSSLLTRLEKPYTPDNPSGPSKAMIVLAGCLGGLVAGLGWVFLTVAPVGPQTPAVAVATLLRGASDPDGARTAPLGRASVRRPAPSGNGDQNTRVSPRDDAHDETIRVLSLKQALTHLSEQ